MTPKDFLTRRDWTLHDALRALAWPAVLVCRRRVVKPLFLMILLYYVGVAAFFSAQTRYRMPLVPLLVVFMAWTLAHPEEVVREPSRIRRWLMILGWALMMVALAAPFHRMLYS
jgi:hypothetical protein